MYLGEALVLEDQSFTMTGILPLTFGFSKRPQGHGYTILEVTGENPYFRQGTTLKGHEFHYSSVLESSSECMEHMAYTMVRGTGLMGGRDGLCYKNVLATYTHLHASGTPEWAPALVTRAREYKTSK